MINPKNTLATDGINCRIYQFDLNCSCCTQCCKDTPRPYRRLRCNIDGSITALGCCNTARVYYLDCNYCETGYTDLDTLIRNSCDSYGGLTDASVTVIGNESFIVGVFEKAAYLFDQSGKRLTKLCAAEENEILTDFVANGNNIFAMSTTCNSRQTITVSNGGSIQSGILERGYTLRMLIPKGDEIYGLFGRSYIYNRIIKIYSNGVLALPKT